MAVTAIPCVQARNFTRGRSNAIDVLVIHTMESPEKPDTAESVANWFAGPTAPQASAHYFTTRARSRCRRISSGCAQIPRAGRIAAVAEVFDALTSDRSCRSALSELEALETIHADTGLDPAVVAALDGILGQTAHGGTASPAGCRD